MLTIYVTIGRNLRLHRQKLGLSQIDLANRCEMTKASISQIESGKQRIAIENLYRVASVLKCSVYDLLPPDLTTDVDIDTAQRFDGTAISRTINRIDEQIQEINNHAKH